MSSPVIIDILHNCDEQDDFMITRQELEYDVKKTTEKALLELGIQQQKIKQIEIQKDKFYNKLCNTFLFTIDNNELEQLYDIIIYEDSIESLIKSHNFLFDKYDIHNHKSKEIIIKLSILHKLNMIKIETFQKELFLLKDHNLDISEQLNLNIQELEDKDELYNKIQTKYNNLYNDHLRILNKEGLIND